MKRLLFAGLLVLSACGDDGPSDSREACTARGGEWYLDHSYTTGGVFISFGNGQGYVTPVQVHNVFECTIQAPKETKP